MMPPWTTVGRLALTVLAALVILCREILVSGLREFLAQIRVSMPVSRLAKWKTAIQITAIGCLLLGNAVPALPFGELGVAGIWAAAYWPMRFTCRTRWRLRSRRTDLCGWLYSEISRPSMMMPSLTS